MIEKVEYICCSANWYDDGVERVHNPINTPIGFVVCGLRHHNCINTFAEIVGFPYSTESFELENNSIEGFLTSKNRFVDRTEGGKIAFLSGQTDTLIKKLHSEDLY